MPDPPAPPSVRMRYAPRPLAPRRAGSAPIVALLPVLACLAAATPADAQRVQPPYWGSEGITCGDVENPDRSGFTSHPELGARLRSIAGLAGGAFHAAGPAPVLGPASGSRATPRTSGARAARVVVDVPGRSVRGREIYRVRVGSGPIAVLLVGNIHGNEKHGMEALQNVLGWLAVSEEPEARHLREELTIVAVPMLNPDGSILDRRHNDQDWELVQRMYPSLAGEAAPWYYNERSGGFDLNRDFSADFSLEPSPATLPERDGLPGSFLGTESRTIRTVFAELLEEFGRVELIVDLHNQGSCPRDDANGGAVSHMSIAGWLGSDYPEDVPLGVDSDMTRRANVAVFDALQIEDTEWRFVTRFAPSLGRPGAMLGAAAAHGTATVLIETSASPGIGDLFKDFLVEGVEIALTGLLGAFADGSIHELDPDGYDAIPVR